MFFTGDSDTRVDPLHARKMTALLQTASTSGRPILLHYSLAGGHSAGVSVDQQIQDDADQLTFLWTETRRSSQSSQTGACTCGMISHRVPALKSFRFVSFQNENALARYRIEILDAPAQSDLSFYAMPDQFPVPPPNNASSFASLLASFTGARPKTGETWDDSALLDDVTTISYEQALRSHRRVPAARPRTSNVASARRSIAS